MARMILAGIANEAKNQFYRDNADVVLGVEWLVTLDGRTCFDCASLSRMQWKVDEPHPIPPLHPNCRCVLLPVTALSMLVDEVRPAAKSDFMADAKRMYEAKYPGKRFEDLAESTRKKYYYDAIHAYEARTGQPAFELVRGRVAFKDYFENVMTEQQRKDWLGPQRYKIWRHGNLSTDKFINPYPNRQFTVDELKELDKNSFAQKSPVIAMERSKPLTREEVEAVLQYTRSDDYAELNSYLRTGKTGNEYFDTETRLLNAAISKTQTTEDMIVWRGVKSLTLRNGNEPGKSVPVAAFTSTSTSRSIAEKFAGVGDDAVIYKITLPKGTNAIDAMGISRKPEEDEILLSPTGFFKQSRVYYEKDTLRQIVEVIYEQ